MLTIKDIVNLDDKAEFRSDVQLDAFDHPRRNIALLQSYLFSSATPTRELSVANHRSSVDLLNELVNIYLNEQKQNRLTIIADYGHGKSHLALAMANYFSKASDSPELKIVNDKLGRALNDPAKASRFRDFKESKGEFLLIRIRGDVPESLPAQFLSGLERGLAEHSATQDVKPPFWHEQAESYLEGLTPEQKAKANAFLAKRDSELPLLLQDIRAHEDVFEEAVDAIKAATGVKPELREVSLARAVEWATESFVGPGKPFGGILIIFDEFTLYLNKYARRNAAADLQDLLNGVDNQRGKVAFVAFAQVDPDTTAENLTLDRSERADLKKALNRLQLKRILYSLLESVIDAYLKQSKAAWEEFNEPMPVRGQLSGASDIALISFSKRYDRTLRWSPTKFQDTITKGCFPLHPITTILLCNMNLSTTADIGVPRTVLGFVMEQLKVKQPQLAIQGKRPNWVLPISLIEYFESRLSGDSYVSYQNARRTAGADLTDDQEAILKALLLYELGEVRARSDDQFDFLCQCTGLERHAAGDALNSLVAGSNIRHDGFSKTYSLWPVTADPQRLDRALRTKLEAQRFDKRALADLNEMLSEQIGSLSFGLQPLDVGWGHSSDWGAREQVVTAEIFTAEKLKELVQKTKFGSNGNLDIGARGHVLWALARKEEDRDYFRQNAERIFDEAFPGESPIPIVLVLPDRPQPGLIDSFLRKRALNALNNTERQDIGKEMLDHEERRINRQIVKAMTTLRGVQDYPFSILRPTSSIVVPAAYRAPIKAIETDLNGTLLECYKLAYRWRPPHFDTRYRVVSKGSNKLRTATMRIASAFLHNASKSLPDTTRTDRFTRDLYEKHLQRSWGILGKDYRLQKPIDKGVIKTWNLLDSTFAPGKDSVRLSTVIAKLLNPPFGYDFNTAVLLFTSWFGYNSADIKISQKGHPVSADVFDPWLTKDSKGFLRQIHENAIAILKRDPNDAERELREILASYDKKTYTPSQANQIAANIQDLATDDRIALALRQQAENAKQELQQAAEAALEYDRDAREIETGINKASSLSRLLQLQRKIGNLKPVGLVHTDAPQPNEVRDSLYAAIEQVSKRSAAQYGNLPNVGSYELHRKRLLEDRKLLKIEGYSSMVAIFDKAIEGLGTQQEQLLAEAGESETRAVLSRMRTDTSLAALYDRQEYLTNLSAQSESTIKLRDEKLSEAQVEIARMEREANTLCNEVLNHKDHKSLKFAHNRLLQISDRYSDTPFAENLEITKNLMDQYEQFLGALNEINQKAKHLQDFESAEILLGDLAKLEDENKDWMLKKHHSMLNEAKTRVEDQLKVKQLAAGKWLERIKVESQNDGKSVLLLREIQNAPAFLTQEQQTKLSQLAQQIQRRIDQDVFAQIEQQFLSIQDPDMQRACITRLQQLIGEEQAVTVAIE